MSDRARTRIVNKAHSVFLDKGYNTLSMAEIAEGCGLTRRALYHHFSNKDELFRAALRIRNAAAIMDGDAASDEALAREASPIDVIGAWLDARFGATRREIVMSSHGLELNDAAFRIGMDIIIEVSFESNRKLAELIAELCRRDLLQLRTDYSCERVGRLIGDGARGVNQARPPIPQDEIAGRYREIVEVILYGCTAQAAA